MFGGAGLTGLLFIYMRRFIDKRLERREQEDTKRKSQRLRRLTIEDEWYHAVGRYLYFVNKFIETDQHNGDLRNAWERFQAAEDKKKTLDREIIAENELEE